MIESQPFEVKDFDGGITDNYLDGVANQYRFADNFVITDNKKLYTRPGSEIYLENDPQVPLGAQRIGALVNFNDEYLFTQVSQRLFFTQDETDVFGTVLGPSGNDVFSTGSSTSRISWGIWNNQIIFTNSDFAKPMKVYEDDVSTLQVRNAGLPALASSPTITPVAGTENYLYAFVYTYEYMNKDLTFLDAGPTKVVPALLASPPDVDTIAITAIPVLVNGAGDNYDTANIKVEIYRTITNGDVFYFVGEVTNGTTTFNDNNSDTTIQSNFTLYTTDGTVDNFPAPLSKYVHVTNNTAYYAHIKESNNDIRPNRIFKSLPGIPHAVGASFFVDVEDSITGINSYQFTPIVFCRASIYRIDDTLDESGAGSFTQQNINDTVGCVSNLSIVRTRMGTFFAGTDGFYWTDGYDVQKISNEFDSRYLQLLQNNKDRIFGTYDDENNRVTWALQSTGSSNENDTIYCLDLRFGRPPKTFTTWKGNDDTSSFRPSALCYYQKKFLRADSRGYIFIHSPQIFTDPKVDILEDPADWAQEVIRYNYVSAAFNMGTDFIRKWIPKIVITADDDTNLSLAIGSINDDGRIVADLAPITFNNVIIWGDPDIVWGTPDIIWNYQGLIQEQRRFPSRGLRCAYKQVVLTNAYSLIDDSTANGQVSVNSVLKTATLIQVNANFPTKSVDYFISFSNDNFTKQYKILSVTPTTVEFEDISNQSASGNYDWQINGYPKDEILNLLGYVIHYSFISKTQTPFIAGGS